MSPGCVHFAVASSDFFRTGVSAYASRSHPRNGIDGFPMSGLRSYSDAHTYQRSPAAIRSHLPASKHTLKIGAVLRTAPTNNGESVSQKMLGNARHSGLSEGEPSTPSDENNSFPQGCNRRKCCSR